MAIAEHWLADESSLVEKLVSIAEPLPEQAARASRIAADWVRRVRKLRDRQSPLDAFMHQYDLSSEEGVLLMCLAEALLRIPDDDTAEKLIADKLAAADWARHLGQSDSVFVNASTWGLMFSGRLVRLPSESVNNFRAALNRLVGRSSEPVIRMAVRQAMRMMGQQFVMGSSIGEALKRAQSAAHRPYRHSFDMLGEAALTAADADRYFAAYRHAIEAIGGDAGPASSRDSPATTRPGISVKLSALHPCYEPAKRERVLRELTPRVLQLAQQARRHNIGLTIDAEEADRLELSLDIVEAVFCDPSLSDWDGFGLVVQAFQKRALPTLDWLEALARRAGRRLCIRLAKGAYWDTEIKRAQERGLSGYPVFTRKLNTDVSYLACARRLLAARDVIYPQFATHNAQTVAAVRVLAADDAGFEFQRLHGMGEALYEVVSEDCALPCRVYAPVGSHQDLLPYLVRRLLENGANSSFVNRLFDESVPPEELAADPVQQVKALALKPDPGLPLPAALYGAARRNSAGVNLADDAGLAALAQQIESAAVPSEARSVLARAGPEPQADHRRAVTDPADRGRVLGYWAALPPQQIRPLAGQALEAAPGWDATPLEQRCGALERAADLFEAQQPGLLKLLIREAGKTLPDSLAEVREAVDFLRYYAARARGLLVPETLPGPTGEHNELQLHGRGVFACISPWNFPLAIFTGQIAAALVAGNSVIAKPAEQTNLIAVEAVKLMHRAGIPVDVLQCVLGEGDVGAALVADPRIAGVAFTGSLEVARQINRSLAARDGPIGVLIAETGGQNAMIVDSSALPEQVVKDVIHSAFLSAGQRCSALRVLYLQQEIADRIVGMLRGAMRELSVGDPGLLSTDVGPVIDEPSRARLAVHAERMERAGRLIERLPLPPHCAAGSYFAPCAVEIDAINQLDGEYFGPMLHVIRYAARDLDAVVDAINASGYGLTLGVHSRIEATWKRVQARARVGNCYVNRGMTGAVVGVQPFGGEGLSGTGPKAGGPHYLLRFASERTLTVNTAAVGGNAGLLARTPSSVQGSAGKFPPGHRPQ